jgi:hypothetical protein
MCQTTINLNNLNPLQFETNSGAVSEHTLFPRVGRRVTISLEITFLIIDSLEVEYAIKLIKYYRDCWLFGDFARRDLHIESTSLYVR